MGIFLIASFHNWQLYTPLSHIRYNSMKLPVPVHWAVDTFEVVILLCIAGGEQLSLFIPVYQGFLCLFAGICRVCDDPL